jgi:hypothetical protein
MHDKVRNKVVKVLKERNVQDTFEIAVLIREPIEEINSIIEEFAN